MIDLRLSDDGDLMLGQQATNREGHLLYYYPMNQDGDIGITTDPLVANAPVRDVEMIYGAEGDAQLIRSRLRTENPDWLLYKNIGADLTDLLGEMNTPETAQRGIDAIYRALTYDKAFSRNELEVDAVPVSHTKILFHVKLIRNETIVTYAATLDFELNSWNEYDLSISPAEGV